MVRPLARPNNGCSTGDEEQVVRGTPCAIYIRLGSDLGQLGILLGPVSSWCRSDDELAGSKRHANKEVPEKHKITLPFDNSATDRIVSLFDGC